MLTCLTGIKGIDSNPVAGGAMAREGQPGEELTSQENIFA